MQRTKAHFFNSNLVFLAVRNRFCVDLKSNFKNTQGICGQLSTRYFRHYYTLCLKISGGSIARTTAIGQNIYSKKAFSYLQICKSWKRRYTLCGQQDPRQFLKSFAQEPGLILDEFQHVPTILSYIQTIVDEEYRPGFFILTGSQNFLLNQHITQSLAGRVGILTLLPLSNRWTCSQQSFDRQCWVNVIQWLLSKHLCPTFCTWRTLSIVYSNLYWTRCTPDHQCRKFLYISTIS